MTQVVAVSVGTPRWEDVCGHQVFTSIVRDPHPGPIFFGPAGPEGNATAVHTEHVLALSAEHYDYWSEIFGVERTCWAWSRWGENLTLSAADENALSVGDALRIGETAVFRVNSPRIPCSKLAWRLGQTDAVLRHMIETGRIGIYLSVVTPGWVQPGDPVELVERADDTITVGDLSRLLIDNELKDTNALRRVLAIPALGAQAYGMILNRIGTLTDGARTRTGRWHGWREMVVSAIRQEAAGVRSFTLASADGAPLAPFRGGQFLTVQVPLGDEPVARTWSLSDYQEDAPATYRIAVKRASLGAASAWMHMQVEPGTVLKIRPPAGRFVLERGSFYRIVMISAGVGVTPLLAMLKAHAARGPEAPPLVWIHATTNGTTHAFKDEANGILDTIAGAIRLVLYSNPTAADRPGEDYDRAGRLSPEVLAGLIGPSHRIQPFGRSLELGGEFSTFYVCGPDGFETMVRGALADLKVSPNSIWSERFVVPTRAGQGTPAIERAEIVFARSKITAQWSVDDDKTLLELAESAGLTPDFGCRMGACQTCETGLTQGLVTYDLDPAVPPPSGRILLCCSRPKTATVVLDL